MPFSWVPDMPAVMYHGDKRKREDLRRGLPSDKSRDFPAIITSYEIVLADAAFFRGRSWKYVVVDEVCPVSILSALCCTPTEKNGQICGLNIIVQKSSPVLH